MDENLEDYLYETKLFSDEIKMLFAFDVDIGTKLFNPKSFDGLGRVIDEEQPNVIIFSQIFPYIPIHHGARLKEFMRVIDNDIMKKYGRKAWLKVKKERKSNESYQSIIMDNLNSPGIRNLNEIAIISSVLFDEKIYEYVPEKTRIIYLWSEADWKNIDSFRQKIIAEEYDKYLKKLKAVRKEVKAELKELKSQIEDPDDIPKELEERISELDKKLYQIDEELMRSRYADFTKTWREYPEMDQKATDEARRSYEEILSSSFGKLKSKLEIVHYNALKLCSEESEILVGYNLNMIYSNTPITTSIQRNRNLLRGLKARGLIDGEKLKMVVDGSMHKGGFRVVTDNLSEDFCNPIYIIKPPTFNEWNYEFSVEKSYKNKLLKAGYYEPYASGIIVPHLTDTIMEVRYVSAKDLANYKKRKGRKQKTVVLGDFHVGSVNNDLNQLTNYQLIDRMTKYIKKSKPDVIILTGDLVEGAHLPQITYRVEDKTIYDKQNILKKIKSNPKRYRQYVEMLLQENGISNISQQKKELKERFIDEIIPLVHNKTEVIVVSGQHYNKSVNYKEDEAIEISLMFPEELKKYVHPVHGDEIGVGTATTRNGTKFYVIHGPRVPSMYLDPAYALLKQGIKSATDAKIIAAGDIHLGSVAIGDGKIAVLSPSAQQMTPFMRKHGGTQQPRGMIEILYTIDKKGVPYVGDVKFRFLLDPFWYSYKV